MVSGGLIQVPGLFVLPRLAGSDITQRIYGNLESITNNHSNKKWRQLQQVG